MLSGSKERRWLGLPAFFVFYSFALLLSSLWIGATSDADVFSPSSGLILAALLLADIKHRLPIVFAALTVNILFGLVLEQSIFLSVVNFGCNIGGAFLAVHLATRILGSNVKRLGLKESIVLVCVGLLATAVATSLCCLLLAEALDWSITFRDWLLWWSADFLSVVLFPPLLLSWQKQDFRIASLRKFSRKAELVGLMVLLTMFIHMTFGRPMDQAYVFRYPLILCLAWATLRFGRKGITGAGLWAAALSVCWVSLGLNSSSLIDVPLTVQLLGLNFFYGSLLATLTGLAAAAEERKHASEALRASEARYRFLFEKSLVPMVEIDMHAQFQKVNQSFEEFCGIGRTALIDKMTIQEFVHPDDLPQSRQLMEKLMQGDISYFIQEKRYVVDDGRTKDALVLVRGIFDADDHYNGASISILDISERKQREADMALALKEKEVLLMEIHHRVKNNLQIIMSLLSLQEQGEMSPDARRILSDSRGRVMSMALIHEQLYNSQVFSRIDVRSYLNELLPRLHTAYRGGCAVEIRLDAQPVTLSLDQAIPFGLITNELVTNAFKHAFEGRREGFIAVSVNASGDMFTFSIEDNGVGFSNDLPIDSPATLGLKMSALLANQLGGTLTTIASSGGSRFQLEFPLK
ncbi:histidine kinase dimerization/phosphoacceptor domain -containing protein [Fundidesulfovibrio putealis]|uniref:histidine kinase dimerization/phosphoacceptor domain -containing protein n=1 Tax=Fundidesulfovibrio putealis TaxID=270496 RepID=UPI0003FE4933|nr:histidine kinase dimerization/phosphoacceptor domain -containing protein [Fundidesulfovibrio putealis]